MKKQYLEIGKIVTVHGLNGTVKVQPWCDSPEILCQFDTLYRNPNGENAIAVSIEQAKVQKNMVLMKLAGVDTVEQAQALRNTILYMNRDDADLDEDTYFIQDLLGLSVLDADTDVCYGTISDVLQTGANDVYVIRDEAGKERLVPVIPDVVCSVSVDEGVVVIRPLPGLFD
ncbi:MAG: 16S rRNA processing protein RimM [Oscillospiraceae bacterium]|nr:16S rRNA processing protein RimM [Oscillospiraceae bacterium]